MADIHSPYPPSDDDSPTDSVWGVTRHRVAPVIGWVSEETGEPIMSYQEPTDLEAPTNAPTSWTTVENDDGANATISFD